MQDPEKWGTPYVPAADHHLRQAYATWKPTFFMYGVNRDSKVASTGVPAWFVFVDVHEKTANWIQGGGMRGGDVKPVLSSAYTPDLHHVHVEILDAYQGLHPALLQEVFTEGNYQVYCVVQLLCFFLPLRYLLAPAIGSTALAARHCFRGLVRSMLIKEFSELKRELREVTEPRPLATWPVNGAIKCENLVSPYADIINKGGEAISPFEIEEVAASLAKEYMKPVIAFSVDPIHQ
ncbi:hypothetical protein A0H81_12064 [Grifola frondosa]|uniref:Uncharacterized protein n=1 Tax=Grifola frondosa TaxID=5627 RepID=A0A1C7LT94_GRIFR|nr:hypothetical protein A0H81_12064 [Grifola frondosa]